MKQLVNSCARRVAKSISFKRFIQEEIKLTGKLYEEAENFITSGISSKYMYQKGKKLLQVSVCKRENRGISDGGKQLVFRGNDLPIHHFVV